MTRITTTTYMDLAPTNDNSEGVYLMREVYVSFKKSQYVPVRCCDVVPENAFMVRV